MYSSFQNFGHSFKLAYFSSLNTYKNSDTVCSAMIHIPNEIKFNAIFSTINRIKFIFKEKGCNENKVQKSLCTHIITITINILLRTLYFSNQQPSIVAFQTCIPHFWVSNIGWSQQAIIASCNSFLLDVPVLHPQMYQFF